MPLEKDDIVIPLFELYETNICKIKVKVPDAELLYPNPLPRSGNTGRKRYFHTDRRKTRRENRKVILPVLAVGGDWRQIDRRILSKYSLLQGVTKRCRQKRPRI
jgi:hypothetical protein